jgi:hypothetical protein
VLEVGTAHHRCGWGWRFQSERRAQVQHAAGQGAVAAHAGYGTRARAPGEPLAAAHQRDIDGMRACHSHARLAVPASSENHRPWIPCTHYILSTSRKMASRHANVIYIICLSCVPTSPGSVSALSRQTCYLGNCVVSTPGTNLKTWSLPALRANELIRAVSRCHNMYPEVSLKALCFV